MRKNWQLHYHQYRESISVSYTFAYADDHLSDKQEKRDILSFLISIGPSKWEKPKEYIGR